MKCQKHIGTDKACVRQAVEGSDFCAWHDPTKVHERGRRGGHGKAAAQRAKRAEELANTQPVALATAEQMRAAIERALGRVEALGLDPIAMGNATARLVSTAMQIYGTFDVQQQIAELRALVNLHIPQARNHANGAH
jgi:hypothetical protein